MPAIKRDFTIEQGATFEQRFILKRLGVLLDLTGYSARMQLRQAVESAAIALELTTENARIELTPEGTMRWIVDAVTTAALPRTGYVYDTELVDPTGKVDRIFEGKVTISAEVTR
jgi:predicted ABC-class ATPase